MPRLTKRSLLAGVLILCPLAVFASGVALPYASTRYKKSPFASARKVDANLRRVRCLLNKLCALIAVNAADIAASQEAIAANQEAIAANAAAGLNNQAAIQDNQAAIAANQLAASDAQALAASAQAGVSANAARIDSQAAAIADNQAAIAANAAAIAALQEGDGDDGDDGGEPDPDIVFADDFERPDSDTIGNGWVEVAGLNAIVNGELQLIGHNGAGDGGRPLGDPVVYRCVGFRPDFDLFVTARIDDIATRVQIGANLPAGQVTQPPRQLFVVSDPPSPDQFLELRADDGSSLVRAPITMLPGVRYRFRLTYKAGVMAAKFWPESAPEPQGYLISTPYQTPMGQNLVLGANISGVTTRSWQFDDVVLKN